MSDTTSDEAGSSARPLSRELGLLDSTMIVMGSMIGSGIFLTVQTGTIAAVAVAFARFLGVLSGAVTADPFLVSPVILGRYAVSLSTQQLVALAMIVALTLTNMLGLKAGRLIQNTFTITK